jgi:transcriptional regulator with XRE-family HTH domain
MNISEWLRDKRENRQPPLGKTELGLATGITQSGISRLESGDVLPTLETIVKIAQVLNEDENSVFEAITNGSKIALPNLRNIRPFPSLSDLEKLNHVAKKDVKQACTIISGLHNSAAIGIPSGSEQPGLVFFELNEEQVYPYVMNYPIAKGKFEYPDFIDSSAILELLTQDAVVTHEDLMVFVRAILLQRKTVKQTLKEVNLIHKIEYSNPFNDSIGNMKLNTLLEIDEMGNQQGKVFLLGWRAVEYENYRSKLEKDSQRFDPEKLGHLLIILSRWLATLRANPNWLAELRKDLDNILLSTEKSAL